MFSENQTAKKKENKIALEKEIENRDKKFISCAYEIANELEVDNVKFISVSKEGKTYILFYISDKPINDRYDFREIAFLMSKEFKKKFILRHIKNIYGSFAVI